jgi:hypothetical protein
VVKMSPRQTWMSKPKQQCVAIGSSCSTDIKGFRKRCVIYSLAMIQRIPIPIPIPTPTAIADASTWIHIRVREASSKWHADVFSFYWVMSCYVTPLIHSTVNSGARYSSEYIHLSYTRMNIPLATSLPSHYFAAFGLGGHFSDKKITTHHSNQTKTNHGEETRPSESIR